MRSSTRAEQAGCTIHLPYDVVVAKEFAPNPPSVRTCNVHEVAADEMILDVGPAAVEALADVLKTCRTLVWNGPLGAFETPPFDAATVALAQDRGGADQGRLAGFGRRRRRYGRRAQPCRRRRGFHLRLDRGRSVSRMDGRAHAAGRRGARTATGWKHESVGNDARRSSRATASSPRSTSRAGPRPRRSRATASRTAPGRTTRRCSASSTRCASRIITSPCFGSGKVIGAILFERTMDGEVDGKPTPQALIDRGVVPFIKIDKGLEDEENGVQMMKPMPELDALARAGEGARRVRHQGALGHQPRQPRRASPCVVAQQFEVAKQVLAHGMMPIIEPEVNIKSADRADSRPICCSTAILEELDEIPDGQRVMLKLSIPAEAGPVRAAGRPSQGAARGRAVGRLLRARRPAASWPRTRA